MFTPKIGTRATVNLGDQMMVRYFGWEVDCVVPNFDFSSARADIRRDVPICGGASGVNYFRVKRASTTTHTYTSWGVTDEWSISEIGNGQSSWCYRGHKNSCHERPITDYEKIKQQRASTDNFQQVIEYMGRNDNILSFVYAEFKENTARAPFTRNFQIDLSKGNTVNYKGAEIEIIEADNVKVTYIIRKGFDS